MKRYLIALVVVLDVWSLTSARSADAQTVTPVQMCTAQNVTLY